MSSSRSPFLGNYTVEEVRTAMSPSRWEHLSGGSNDAILIREDAVLVSFIESNVDDVDPEVEGQEDVYVVVKIGTQFFKQTGYYTSHSGSSWYGTIKEVKPVQKTVTVYE